MKSLRFLLLIATAAFALTTGATAAEHALEPQLKEIAPETYQSGSMQAEIDGQSRHFLTTIKTIFIDPGKMSSNPAIRKEQEKMNGTIVKTAQLRLERGQVVANLIGESKGGDALELSFTLEPKGLALQQGARSLRYKAANASASDRLKADNFELTVETVTRLPSGGLSLKGHFSGTLATTVRNKPLEQPVAIQGTFDIVHASGDEDVIAIVHEGWD